MIEMEVDKLIIIDGKEFKKHFKPDIWVRVAQGTLKNIYKNHGSYILGNQTADVFIQDNKLYAIKYMKDMTFENPNIMFFIIRLPDDFRYESMKKVKKILNPKPPKPKRQKRQRMIKRDGKKSESGSALF